MMHHALALAMRDRLPLRKHAVGQREVLDALMGWLAHAQDVSGCDGVSAYYDLQKDRWAAAYPETTGYIIPTMFDYADFSGNNEFRERALRMADWETAIQLSDGAVQAGTLGAVDRVPTVFNTGQVLFGWARAYRETQRSRYAKSLRRAADWLVSCQDEDGAWRKFPSPYSCGGVNAYNTRTAFGLVEAAQGLGDARYTEAARRNIEWVLSTALPNGWLPNNCLEDAARPLTHTVAYAIRGILEVSDATGNIEGLDAAVRMALAVAGAQRSDGALPGRIDRNWQGTVQWSCITGNAQMAIIWLRLALLTNEKALRAHAIKSIEFCMGQINLDSRIRGVRGGVKGSHPFDGGYMRYRYPNWSAKFMADALMLMLSFDREYKTCAI